VNEGTWKIVRFLEPSIRAPCFISFGQMETWGTIYSEIIMFKAIDIYCHIAFERLKGYGGDPM
jgi:hypothetical protein